MIFFNTNRLNLRNVEHKDVQIIYDYRNNEICAQYQRGQAKVYDGIINLVAQHTNDTISVDVPCMVAVALKETDEMVGEIIIMPNDGTISLGYTFSYKHHRKGYAFESISAIMEHLHKTYPDWDFICFTEKENIPSINLLKKLGYRDMGYIQRIESQVFGKWTTPVTDEEIQQAVAQQ